MSVQASGNRKKQKNKISNRKTILKITVSTGIGKSQKQKHEIKNRKAIKNRCQCEHREITKTETRDKE